MKNFYISLLKSTNRKGIDDLIAWLESSDFFIAPASTQYHGAYAGGLLEHSCNVYNALIYELEGLHGTDLKVPEIPQDSVIITALLHDICKANCYVESTRNVKNEKTGEWEKKPFYKRDPIFPMGHGGKSVFIAQQFIQLTPQEAQAIFWHMGAYDTSNYMTLNELGSAYEHNLLALMLNAADMKATYILENENYNIKNT